MEKLKKHIHDDSNGLDYSSITFCFPISIKL